MPHIYIKNNLKKDSAIKKLSPEIFGSFQIIEMENIKDLISLLYDIAHENKEKNLDVSFLPIDENSVEVKIG